MSTPTSIAYAHTFNDKGEITGRQVSAFYYLPEGCASYTDVPVGAGLSVVYVHNWHFVQLQVILAQVEKVDAKPCRYYRQIRSEKLKPDEIEYYQTLLEWREGSK